LHRLEIGSGRVSLSPGGLDLLTEDVSTERYSNAQVDDTQGLPRQRFRWRPPLTLHVRACFTHSAAKPGGGGIQGTAGFGFWNDFLPGARLPTLPRAIWFFYASPPSDIRLDVETPGQGWKAATIDALRPVAPLMLASAPLAVPLIRRRGGFERIWPHYQQALRIREAAVTAPMDEWHIYTLAWGESSARFWVDNALVLASDTAPAAPLGLVAWQDNQFLIAAPWGRLRHGLLAAPGRQGLQISNLEISAGTS